MRKIFWFIVAAVIFSFVIGQPICAAMEKPENPVHERRKAEQEKRKKKVYGPKVNEKEQRRLMEEAAKAEKAEQARIDAIVEKSIEERSVSKSEEKKKDVRPALIREFDKDNDGVISFEEMDAAKKAGKEKSLRALLASEKKKKDGQKSKTTPEDAKSSSAVGQEVVIEKGVPAQAGAYVNGMDNSVSGPKEIIVRPGSN